MSAAAWSPVSPPLESDWHVGKATAWAMVARRTYARGGFRPANVEDTDHPCQKRRDPRADVRWKDGNVAEQVRSGLTNAPTGCGLAGEEGFEPSIS